MWTKRCAKADFFFFIFLFCLASVSFGQEALIFKTSLNTEEKGEFFGFITPEGDVLLPDEDILGIGIVLKGETSVVDGKSHVSLRSLSPRVRFEFNERNLTLHITADPAVLRGSKIDFRGTATKKVEFSARNSAFLNYSIILGSGADHDFSELNAPFETGIRWGDLLFFSGFAYKKNGGIEKLTRFFSNVVRDDRASMQRLTAGDFTAYTGKLGGSGILGGISVSKNFTLDPGFVTSPGVNLSGLLSLPSDVELWLDGVPLKRQRFSPGGFELQNIPTTMGANEATVIIRDAFGREKTMVVPFYFAPALLKKGLHEYSYNIGLVRERFGYENFRYTDPAILLAHRYGFTDSFTGGLRAEFTKELANVGLTAGHVINGVGAFDAALAYSSNRKNGYAYSLDYSYFSRKKGAGLQFSLKGLSRDYSNFNLAPKQNKAKVEMSSSVSYGSRPLGSISLNYNYINTYTGPVQRRLALNYSRQISKSMSFIFSASSTRTDRTASAVFVALNYIFGKSTSASFSYQKTENNEGRSSVSVQRIPERTADFGYRVTAEKSGDNTERYDAILSYNGKHGIYSGRYGKSGPNDFYELMTSGSISTLNGSLYFGQPIYDSFAVVKVGNLENTSVYYSNSLVGKTDSKGEILVPYLVSYHNNMLSFNEKDVPMNYSFKELEKYVSPFYRGGAFVEFKGEKVRSIVGKIFVREAEKETAAEFWQLVLKAGGNVTEAPVAREGEFYLENIPAGIYRASVSGQEKTCEFDLTIPDSEEIVFDMGRVFCEIPAGQPEQ